MSNIINKIAGFLFAMGALLSFSGEVSAGAGVLIWAIDPGDGIPKVLLGKRATSTGYGKWCNMGGMYNSHHDNGHTSVTAARETKEETFELYMYNSNNLADNQLTASHHGSHYTIYMPLAASSFISACFMRWWIGPSNAARRDRHHPSRISAAKVKTIGTPGLEPASGNYRSYTVEYSDYRWVPMIDFYKVVTGRQPNANLGVDLWGQLLNLLRDGHNSSNQLSGSVQDGNNVRNAMRTILLGYYAPAVVDN